MFVNKAGTLTLYSQSQIRSQTDSIVPQAEYGNGVGFMGNSIGTEVQLQYDGDSMRNVANVEMSGGGVYIQENTTSSATYGEAEQFIATQVQTIEDADQVADIIVGWGGQVYAKASPVSVVLSPTASWASTLGLELFDRFTLQVTPPSGNAITTPMLASRIAHSVTPERWVTTLEGSARWAAVFILNQSRLGGTDLLG
jgi:glycine/D-amino acid oxidase-like deaminating enzyme